MTAEAPGNGQRVALTGSTGFLGRAVARALLERGHGVLAMARPETPRARLIDHPALEAVECADVRDAAVAERLAAATPDAFVHLGWAGVAGHARGEVDHVSTNVPVTIGSVRLAAAAGCRYWLGIGSQAEYGPSPDVLRETSALRPVTDYGVAKVAAAAASHAVGDAIGIPTGWGRVFSVYGAGDHAVAVLPYAISSMLEGVSPQLGPCTHDWDFLHVDDAAAAIVALVEARASGPFNIASGTAQPLRTAIELAADAIGGEARPAYDEGRPPGTPLRASIDRITAATGWMPRTSLAEGIRETVEHLRQSEATASIGRTP